MRPARRRAGQGYSCIIVKLPTRDDNGAGMSFGAEASASLRGAGRNFNRGLRTEYKFPSGREKYVTRSCARQGRRAPEWVDFEDLLQQRRPPAGGVGRRSFRSRIFRSWRLVLNP